jgi:hypothetical protein
MASGIDYTRYLGKKFNRLTVLSFEMKWDGCIFMAECECGIKKWYDAGSVLTGHTKSCGCLKIEIATKRMTTHGNSSHPLRGVMASMYSRCYCEKHGSYPNYGGRGIGICQEWLDNFLLFFEWAIRNGWERGLQIDRIDNDKDYGPENCRIVTRHQQNRNKRNNINITFNGETKCLKDWADQIGINSCALKYRLKTWDLERAMTTPNLQH